MDHSKSRKSDAAATRKRRSSILKSRSRAPLAELEFNVATPPDQAKSRRVSFSRRTGVAEFEINDATTAWKNVYEEHNKSLESSVNESGVKAAPRRVAHLGGRAAHFSDDEADVIDTSEPEPPPRAEHSQLTHTHNTVQLFRLDANPGLRELTDNLNVDFSAVAPLNDLDVLRQDLECEPRPANISEYSIDVDFNETHFTLKADDDDMSITNTIPSPSVTTTETRSQVDWAPDKENIAFNPYVAPKASDNFAVSDDGEDILVFDGKKCKLQSNLDLSDDEFKPSKTFVYDDAASDMSVTQAVARDEVIQPGRVERTVFLNNDMTVTGIVPAQILPCEMRYDKPSKTVVYDDAASDMSVTQAVARVVLPARNEVIPSGRIENTMFHDNDMTVTGVVPAQIFQSEIIDDMKPSRTVVYDDTAGDMSVTQAVERLLLPERDEVTPRSCVDHKTTLLDDDMAMTRTVPAHIFQSGIIDDRKPSRTVVYDDTAGDMSVTQAVERLLLPERDEVIPRSCIDHKTVLLDDNVAMTRTVPAQIFQSGIIDDRKPSRTVNYDDTAGDMSVTQAVERVLLPQNAVARCEIDQKTVLNDSMAMTQALQAEILSSEPNATRRKTIVFDNDDGNISVTQTVPANIINAEKTVLDDAMAMTPAEVLSSEDTREGVLTPNITRLKTVVFDNDDGNISVTSVIPTNIVHGEKTVLDDVITLPEEILSSEDRHEGVLQPNDTRRKTVVFDNDDGNISVTSVIPTNIINEEKPILDDTPVMTPAEVLSSEDRHKRVSELNATRRKSFVSSNDGGNISVTQVIPTSIINAEKTILDDAIAMTRAPPSEFMMSEDRREGLAGPNTTLHKTVVFDNDGNISVTQAAPTNINSQILQPGPKERINISADSILDTLLDMSQASVETLAIEYVPRAIPATASSMTVTDAAHASNTTLTNVGPMSESFIIRGDNEAVNEFSKLANQSVDMVDIPVLEGSQSLSIEYKKDKHGIVCKLQHKLSELKNLIHIKDRTSPKRSPKSMNCSNTEADRNSFKAPASPMDSENRLPINNADLKSASPKNETGDVKNKTLTINLSPRISMFDKESSPVQLKTESFTSRHDCDQEPAEKEKVEWTGQADDTRAILDALSDFTDSCRSLEKKSPSAKKSRRSSAPDRKSMVISREDMLREISMAQAIMKTEMQQTEPDITEGSSDEHETSPPRSECVKTLRFEDDDSIIEENNRVLHKPAGTRSPPRRASTVIPTYDVSEHVKELVHDLIKPMADVAPQCLPEFSRDPSRGSQVDNLESSQIDLIPSTPVLVEPRRSRVRPELEHSEIEPSPSRNVVEPRRRSCLRTTDPVQHEIKTSPRKPAESTVIVFDHLNPLNNILLPSVDQAVVHKYNPRRSNQSLCPSLDSQAVQTDASEPKSQGVECGIVLVSSMVDRSVASECNTRDTEANTSIVMRRNRELLTASSSLTLVDDALARSGCDVSVAAGLRPRSPVRVVFQLDEPCSSVRLDSELTSSEGSEHRPYKREHVAGRGSEVTPKPAIKVAKISSSKLGRHRRIRSLSASPSPSESASASASAASAGPVSTVAALWASSAAGGRAGWRPELLHEPSSKNLASERDPGVNVVARIDVLPFMGTSECEWESRAADTWSFRLLRSRLRLLVRLEHRACNTTRAAVRADTPVRLVLVQHALRDGGESSRGAAHATPRCLRPGTLAY